MGRGEEGECAECRGAGEGCAVPGEGGAGGAGGEGEG